MVPAGKFITLIFNKFSILIHPLRRNVVFYINDVKKGVGVKVKIYG